MNRDPLEAYYARRASEYERIYAKPERQEDLRALARHVARLMAGRDVLEVACGTGYWTRIISAVARSVVATDAGEEVLEIARRRQGGSPRAEPDGPPSARAGGIEASALPRYVQADAFRLESVAGAFDAGFAGFWWSHIARDGIAAFLAGLHGRLEPGSRLLFIDNRYVEGSSTPISRTDARGNTYQKRRLDDGSEHEILKNFPTSAELRGAVPAPAGSVSVLELTYFWAISYELPGPTESGTRPKGAP